MHRILLVLAFLLASGLAFAQEEETIDHVTDDNVIVLQNGEAYQSDDLTSQTWSEGDDVLILDDDKMVDKDANEAVDVIPTTVPDEDEDDDPEN